MKKFVLNHKLQVLAVGVLALAQVTAFVPYHIDRHVAQEQQELATGNGSGVIVADNSAISSNRESQILDAYKRYQEKSKECLVRVRDEDSLKELFRNYRLNSSESNLQALDAKLVDMGFLSSSTSSSSSSNFRDQLLSLESSDSSASTSGKAILDPDDKDDLKEIARCHERRIQDLDTQAEKRAYFKNIESKFADMLAESDSKEISALAREFQKAAKAADPNNALGLQTQAQLHSDYALILANGLAKIRLLERQLALNPTDALLQSRLQLAKTNLDSSFMSLQNRYISQINPQDPNALEQMTALQTISSHWTNQKTSALGGVSGTSFANTVNAAGLTGDPIVNNGLTNGLTGGTLTLPSTTNLLAIPQIVSVPSANLMTVRTDQSRLGLTPEAFQYFQNPANKVPNTARAVPALGMPSPQ